MWWSPSYGEIIAALLLFLASSQRFTLFSLVNTVTSFSVTVLSTTYKILCGTVTFRDVYEYTKLSAKLHLLEMIGCGVCEPHTPYSYIINYYHGTVRHSLVIPRKRGPVKGLPTILHHGEDITEKFLSVVGPHHDFHSIPTTPQMLGLDGDVECVFEGGERVWVPSRGKIPLSAPC